VFQHVVHKALSETISTSWKFARYNQPSSNDEMVAIMKSSVDDHEKTLPENNARVQLQDFVDGSGKHDRLEFGTNEKDKRIVRRSRDGNFGQKNVCGRPCQTSSYNCAWCG
jgi:hypothetical protein